MGSRPYQQGVLDGVVKALRVSQAMGQHMSIPTEVHNALEEMANEHEQIVEEC